MSKDDEDMDRLYVTREGLAKMKRDLDAMKKKRIKAAEAIEHARGLGDIAENAEYHAAKERQAMLHAQMADLEDKIARATILENESIDHSKAYLGATVRVLNKKTGKECSYVLVSPVEADLANGRLSIQSPVGKALLGNSAGDIVTAKVPAGDIEFEILDISR